MHVQMSNMRHIYIVSPLNQSGRDEMSPRVHLFILVICMVYTSHALLMSCFVSQLIQPSSLYMGGICLYLSGIMVLYMMLREKYHFVKIFECFAVFLWQSRICSFAEIFTALYICPITVPITGLFGKSA